MNEKLHDICKIVRQKKIEEHLDVKGACKEVSLAIAIEAIKNSLDVCFCHGFYGTDKDDHHWIRYEKNIYDATFSQFGHTADILVISEKDAKEYEELGYVFFNSKLITELMN